MGGGGFNMGDRNSNKNSPERGNEQSAQPDESQTPNSTEDGQSFPSGGMQRPNTNEGGQSFPSGGMQRPTTNDGGQSFPQSQNTNKSRQSFDKDYSSSVIFVVICVVVLILGTVIVKVYKR